MSLRASLAATPIVFSIAHFLVSHRDRWSEPPLIHPSDGTGDHPALDPARERAPGPPRRAGEERARRAPSAHGACGGSNGCRRGAVQAAELGWQGGESGAGQGGHHCDRSAAQTKSGTWKLTSLRPLTLLPVGFHGSHIAASLAGSRDGRGRAGRRRGCNGRRGRRRIRCDKRGGSERERGTGSERRRGRRDARVAGVAIHVTLSQRMPSPPCAPVKCPRPRPPGATGAI